MKVRVIACGNPYMGNDGIGPAVMARLIEDHPEIDIVDGGLGGFGLIPLMEGCDRIVIVDATTGMGEIGEVRVFHEVPPSSLFPMSLHDLGIAETIAVARATGITAEIVVVGIEGGEIEVFSQEMSPEVRAAIPAACRAVLEEVKKG
ncbi:hydrogenase maturation protease [Methanofollis liminatans DSM 4140]|uniref:Hydrogenase maturation protease n=1 Tax=Methanofollis liminatans DSM 4140 TaxID=28892 RepID=J0S964_9EURY|nr:hydrogenase maturation protease [Methanofollis liminatans]EJG07149.1 hydrogenase maturation protease [Methanofollis liminatans DSM 4140]